MREINLIPVCERDVIKEIIMMAVAICDVLATIIVMTIALVHFTNLYEISITFIVVMVIVGWKIFVWKQICPVITEVFRPGFLAL